MAAAVGGAVVAVDRFRTVVRRVVMYTSFMTRSTLALCVLISACSGASTLASYQGGDSRGSMMVGTYQRFYGVHVPARAAIGPIAPLIIAYHGLGSNSAELEFQTGFDRVADEAGFVVVYPDAAIGQWDVTGDYLELFGIDDIGFARRLIDRISNDFVIDRNRIYAVGISNGAVFAQRLACEVTDQVAGFVAVAGTLSRPARDNCHPSRPVAGLYIIGSLDNQFPVAGDAVVLSVDSMMHYWGKQNQCSRRGTRIALPDTAHDGTSVFRSRFLDCVAGGDIELDSIVNGKHTWPGQLHPGTDIAAAATSRNLSANDEIRRFILQGRSRPR